MSILSKEKIISEAEKLAKSGKIAQAIKELEKASAADPADLRIRLKIADLYAKKKELPKAVSLYQEVAKIYEQEKFHLKAIAVLKTILKSNPTLIQVNEKLGDLYREVGLQEDAVNQYYIVAGYYDSKGMSKEALEIRKKIVMIDPANTTGRIRLAELLQSSGKTDDSVHEYEEAAKLLAKKKDREGLTEVYEKILYFRPENLEMLIDLCRIYFDKREYKKALRKIEGSPEPIRNHVNVLEIWCEALLEDKQVDAARKRFRELYGKLLESQMTERAVKVYSRILQEFGDDQEYLDELSQIEKELGITHQQAKPKHRQDFEATEMVDLNKLDEYLKKKS